MKNLTLLLVLILLPAQQLYAQRSETLQRTQTAAPVTARFEIVQSPISSGLTFRLDKYTGRVWQLVKTKDDFAWQSMPAVDLPQSTDFRVRYQIFASGIVASNIFLLNIETGQTWILTTVKDAKKGDVQGWAPFGN